jgi:hypothetical protein
MNMTDRWRKLSTCATLLLALSYLITPLVDSATCCDSHYSLHVVSEIGSINQGKFTHLAFRVVPSGEDGDVHGKGARAICAVCAHLSGIPSTFHQAISLVAVFVAPETKDLISLPPVFSLFKPPRIG